jgi:hypothetical protein
VADLISIDYSSPEVEEERKARVQVRCMHFVSRISCGLREGGTLICGMLVGNGWEVLGSSGLFVQSDRRCYRLLLVSAPYGAFHQ